MTPNDGPAAPRSSQPVVPLRTAGDDVRTALGSVPWGGAAAARAAGLGPGWARVADAVAAAMPTTDIQRVWLFPPVRRDEREWGTAVVARRVARDRLRVYTAGYVVTVRGRNRGDGRVVLDDVGESPDAVVVDVIRGVQARAGETEPPVEISPDLWYAHDDESPAQG